MSESNVIPFPEAGDRLWRWCERLIVQEAFSAWGMTDHEQCETLVRLKAHWSWIHKPGPFSVTLPFSGDLGDAEQAALKVAVEGYGEQLLAGWRDAMLAALVQLAKVEFSLLRSRAGKPPPFGCEWDSR